MNYTVKRCMTLAHGFGFSFNMRRITCYLFVPPTVSIRTKFIWTNVLAPFHWPPCIDVPDILSVDLLTKTFLRPYLNPYLNKIKSASLSGSFTRIQARLDPTRVEPSWDARLPPLPTNIRLGFKWLTLLQAKAYCNTEIITTVKSFIAQGVWLWMHLNSNENKKNCTDRFVSGPNYV
jgi:hypothetical protein